jgi:putative membrane protein
MGAARPARMKTTYLLALASLLAAPLAACGNDHPANSPDNPPTATTSADNTAVPSASAASQGSSADASAAPSDNSVSSATPAAAADPGASAKSDPLSDEQILQVTHTANVGEIEQAKLAQSKTKDARVKKLAAMMSKEHTQADAKGMSLSKKDKLTPAPSPASVALESDAKTATSSLKSKTGVDFDKDYVDVQVREHQAVLDTLDQKLIPAASNADLKAYLTEVREKVAMHLQHAQDLQTAMQK